MHRTSTNLTLVLAVAKRPLHASNLLPIGVSSSNRLPWPRLAQDMQWFVEKTINRPVIMGYNTWMSIPLKNRPLKNRYNIIITRQHLHHIETSHNTVAVDSIEQAIATAQKKTNLFNAGGLAEIAVIGGAQLIKSMLEKTLIKKIYLTKIDEAYQAADIFIDAQWVNGETKTIKTCTEVVDGQPILLEFQEITPVALT